jgi:hypothetical protein
MTIAAVTGKMTIRAKHPVREDFSECSSGNGGRNYYDTKSSAIRAYESALNEYGLCFDWEEILDMPGNDGRTMIDVWTNELEGSVCVGCAVMMWHRMENSGRYEFTGYLA